MHNRTIKGCDKGSSCSRRHKSCRIQTACFSVLTHPSRSDMLYRWLSASKWTIRYKKTNKTVQLKYYMTSDAFMYKPWSQKLFKTWMKTECDGLQESGESWTVVFVKSLNVFLYQSIFSVNCLLICFSLVTPQQLQPSLLQTSLVKVLLKCFHLLWVTEIP